MRYQVSSTDRWMKSAPWGTGARLAALGSGDTWGASGHSGYQSRAVMALLLSALPPKRGRLRLGPREPCRGRKGQPGLSTECPPPSRV